MKRQDDCVVSFRVPRHNVESRHNFAHPRCRIASNGTLEITAYDRHSISSICPYMRLSKTSLKVTCGRKRQIVPERMFTMRKSTGLASHSWKKSIVSFLCRKPSPRLGELMPSCWRSDGVPTRICITNFKRAYFGAVLSATPPLTLVSPVATNFISIVCWRTLPIFSRRMPSCVC